MPRSRKRAPRDHDSDSGDALLEFPADEVQVPHGLEDEMEVNPRFYTKMIQRKQFTKEGMRTLAGLVELLRRFYPEDYALMTSHDGPMAPSMLLKPPHERDLAQWLVAEILRLQGTCGVSKKG